MKISEGFKWTFCKERRIAEKHRDRCSSSLVAREMQIKHNKQRCWGETGPSENCSRESKTLRSPRKQLGSSLKEESETRGPLLHVQPKELKTCLQWNSCWRLDNVIHFSLELKITQLLLISCVLIFALWQLILLITLTHRLGPWTG